MDFTLVFTKQSEQQVSDLKGDQSRKADYKAVEKTLRYLAQNPRHPSLQSQQYHSLRGPNKEKVFESYAQHKRPSAFRVFWFYGPDRGEITILNIIPHP